MEIAEKIQLAFDEISQRNTRPRKLIADKLIELSQSGETFSTDDLWQELRESDSHIGRATVFRSVEKLVETGVLDRIDYADGSHRYRVCGDHHHHHLTCVQCHSVLDIDFCLHKGSLSSIEQQTHFDIEGHTLTLFGRCEKCQEQKE